MKTRPQFILALLFILMLYALAGCSTLAGPTCADEYSDPELVKICQAVKLSEQRAKWERINRKHMQHGAGGCTPNHSTGGCL